MKTAPGELTFFFPAQIIFYLVQINKERQVQWVGDNERPRRLSLKACVRAVALGDEKN